MSKVCICSQFDEVYVQELSESVKKTVSAIMPFYNHLQDIASKIKECLLELDKDGSGTYGEAETLIVWSHQLYKSRLELINHIKNVIFYSEMRMMPFTIEEEGTNKTTRLVSSIISLLNSHIVSLSEINEYQNLEPSANKMTSSPTFIGDGHLVEINKNLQREKFYRLLQCSMRYGYILHNLQKAIFTVRQLSDKYRHNIEEHAHKMFM
jgi:hypothetical protein